MRVVREGGSSEGVLRLVVVRGGKDGLRGDILCKDGVWCDERLRFVTGGRDGFGFCKIDVGIRRDMVSP